MATWQLTEKGRELGRRLALENPCESSSKEWLEWEMGVIHAVLTRFKLSGQGAAYLEGYEWGRSFEQEMFDRKVAAAQCDLQQKTP